MYAPLTTQPRRSVRRATRTPCHAVGNLDFERLGDLALDLSPRGMLVACDAPVALGEEVIVSFVVPGADPLWLDAEAEIARIVHGYRLGDPGYCVGLRFTYIERSAHNELLTRLAGRPPPIPQRRPPSAARGVIGPGIVRQQPIICVGSGFRSAPRGVFSS
jgi:hypothetical protein